MGRQKLINTEDAILLIDEYYAENPYKKISAEDISRFAATKGINVPGRVLRRDTKVSEYLKSTNDSIDSFINNDSDVIVFRSLNVDSFLSKNSNIKDLKEALVQRDNYYKGLCKRLNLISKENRELKKNVDFSEKEDIKKYKTLVSKQKKFIDKYINPSIANTLLAKEGLLKELNSLTNDPEIIDIKTNFEVKTLNEIARMLDDK